MAANLVPMKWRPSVSERETTVMAQWCLSNSETFAGFEEWRLNLLRMLSCYGDFVPFLGEGVSWLKRSRAVPLRGFEDDCDCFPAAAPPTRR